MRSKCISIRLVTHTFFSMIIYPTHTLYNKTCVYGNTWACHCGNRPPQARKQSLDDTVNRHLGTVNRHLVLQSCGGLMWISYTTWYLPSTIYVVCFDIRVADLAFFRQNFKIYLFIYPILKTMAFFNSIWPPEFLFGL